MFFIRKFIYILFCSCCSLPFPLNLPLSPFLSFSLYLCRSLSIQYNNIDVNLLSTCILYSICIIRLHFRFQQFLDPEVFIFATKNRRSNSQTTSKIENYNNKVTHTLSFCSVAGLLWVRFCFIEFQKVCTRAFVKK